MHLLFIKSLFVYLHWQQLFTTSVSELELLSRRGSISFENADITVSIKSPNGEKIAEAFNATSDVKDLQKMRWVSLGLPHLLIRKSEENTTKDSPFQFVPGGFYLFIETMSQSVATELAKEASQKYGYTIHSNQFMALDKHIGNINCFVKIFDSETRSFIKLVGTAAVIANPVVIFFDLSGYQLTKLASKLYSELNIKDEYEISENAFAEEFIHQLILITNNLFNIADLTGSELNKLSKFGLNASVIKSFDLKKMNVTILIRENFERPIIFSRINKITTDAIFKEQISLSTEDIRVKDIVSECAEAIKASALGEFKAVLTATENIRDSIKQTLVEIKQIERTTNVRIDCSFAMSTRDDYMRTMLRGANLSTCAEFSIPGGHSFAFFTSNGTFTVPPGVHSMRALAVGGGAGGAIGYGGGGGSGYVRVGELAVTPLVQIRVTVGRGGRGSTMKMGDITQNGGGGGRSTLGSLLSADGGTALTTWNIGGSGGSGGGAPWANSNTGTSGAGGTDGGNGANSASGHSGGTGQGAFSDRLRVLKLNTFTAGSGGAGVSGPYIGGGGGGGVLMNSEGPSGGRGQYGNTFGGNGYGAGGAGGYHVSESSRGHPYYAGGDGADGIVYVEW